MEFSADFWRRCRRRAHKTDLQGFCDIITERLMRLTWWEPARRGLKVQGNN